MTQKEVNQLDEFGQGPLGTVTTLGVTGEYAIYTDPGERASGTDEAAQAQINVTIQLGHSAVAQNSRSDLRRH